MSQGLKNIFVLGSVVALLVLAYYLFIQPSPELVTGEADAQSAAVLAQAQLFIERRAQLEATTLNTAFFDDERFTSLRSYKTPEPDQLLGKPDLFAAPLSTDAATLSVGDRTLPVISETEADTEVGTETEAE